MATGTSDRRVRVQHFIPPSPTSAYKVRVAENDYDVASAQRLRYRVFNVELGEGLSESEATGRDADPFDAVCDHLLIEHVVSGEIIGTYRLQTGMTAGRAIGYYSEQEFNFHVFESIRPEIVELGRACIAKEHRNMVVLGLLWKGIAQYAKLYGARYLIGCSSITSTDPRVGQAAHVKLSRYSAEDRFITMPTPRYLCESDSSLDELEMLSRKVEIPRLMRAYLTLGARICGAPALDLDFKTIDFLTLLDLRSLAPRAMMKFLG